jgi:hypothetical protein
MNFRHTHVRREPAPRLTVPRHPAVALRAGWRGAAVLAPAFLVLLVTTWLIWAALAEAALALAEAG